MALIPLLKKMGFLGADGSPTSRYRKFRNTDQSGTALAAGVRQAFSELYARNEYAHELSDSKLKGFVVEITGAKADSTTTRAIVGTFVALKACARYKRTRHRVAHSADATICVNARRRCRPAIVVHDKSKSPRDDKRCCLRRNLHKSKSELVKPMTKSSPENIIRLFGMSTLMVESDLQRVAKQHDLSLREPSQSPTADQVYYPQFEHAVRSEAHQMAMHYEIFYCLEKSIRKLIADKLEDTYGFEWWDEHVSDAVKQNASRAMKNEKDSGVTRRSANDIDYTTFGELG